MQPIRSCLIAAALAAVLTAPVAAQEAAAPGEEPAAPELAPAGEAPAGEAPAGEAPAGEAPTEGAAPAGEATAAPEAGLPPQGEVLEVIRETFGDWQIRCAPEGDDCFMYQLAFDEEKDPVAEVSIIKLPDPGEADAGVTIVTPLGTLLPQGVVVQIDAGQARQYPFAWCSQVGCFARFGLDGPSVAAMKRGKAGKLVLHSIAEPEQPVNLAISLAGFTAAYDSLTVPTAPPN